MGAVRRDAALAGLKLMAMRLGEAAKIRRSLRDPGKKCVQAVLSLLTCLEMEDGYGELLGALVNDLEDLKRQGIRYVTVSQDLLSKVDQPLPRRFSEVSVPETAPAPEPVPAPVEEVAKAAPDAPQTVPSRENQPAAGVPPPPVVEVDRETAMAGLRERTLVCEKCPHLAASRTGVVFGVGSVHAELMFVGEAPGADEDRQGEPFVGKAGQLLTRIIQTMGLSRETVYIANILKCRPDTPGQTAGNRKPTAAEMQTCLPYLLEQIEIIRPRVIVALGATAVEGLLGKTVGITKLRGNYQEFRGVPVMPTYHPSYLMRNQTMALKRELWEDMLQVLEKLGLPITEKQRNYFL
jgi:uracil-DNA glycosylase